MKLALLLTAAASLSMAQPSLDVTPGLDGMLDRYLTVIARRQWEGRAARVAAIRTPAQVRERQEYVRRKLLEEIGGFPAKTPLNARITGTLERSGYRVEKLVFESQPHYYVTADVYVPASGRGPWPAVSGHRGPQHRRQSGGPVPARLGFAGAARLPRAGLRPARPGRAPGIPRSGHR